MILALVDDLLFGSKITGAARQAGVPLKTARSFDAALAAARTEAPGLVLLDLDAARLRPLELVAAFKADPGLARARLVAFVSHVHADLIGQARAAGVDQVLARSGFVAALPEIVRLTSSPDETA
jgi:CheY-like chemotaxis protein